MYGVAGITAGLGVTHLCIAMANYLASKKCKRVACITLSEDNSFDALYDFYMPSILPEELPRCFYKMHGVDYYLRVTKEELPQFLSSGYDAFILDLGVFRPEILNEFYRCDKKFLLNSSAPWRQKQLQDFFLTYPHMKKMEALFFMIVYGNHKDLVRFVKTHSLPGCSLRAVPFFRNPFRIAKEQFPFFEELL